ncbi:MAG: SPOR domain-containing protein [Treponema sp.]|jgi:hypothetical protein|nr:SPOR domain-containing protein [Treponema sp.]
MDCVKRFALVFALVFLSVYCFGQRVRIIGRIPAAGSCRLQVGAFKINGNARAAFARLSGAGFAPAYENYRGLTRVIVPNVAAADIPAALQKIECAGFYEVIIRTEGEVVPAALSPSASALPPEVFEKVWRAVRVNGEDSGGSVFACVFHINEDGSYRVDYLEGNPLSERGSHASAQWRALDESGTGASFEYSWFNWQNAGKAVIRVVNDNYLVIEDLHGEGSEAEKDIWEFSAE